MRVGDTIADRFLQVELVARAGAGGMGEVYKALDAKAGHAVAIKTELDGRASARFLLEASILSELDHPRIVRYLSHGALPSGEPYLAMEWLEGEDLREHLDGRTLSAAETVALGIRVAEALGFAHAQGVVHRDLKPSNILLEGAEIEGAKLVDFGIAQRSLVAETAGVVMGTPAYMAPEQVRGEAPITARADVFSLGCVLFECLTGEPPFAAPRLDDTLAKILFAATPSARERCPEVPEALSLLLERMLAKDPEDRPADGHAAALELGALGELSDAHRDEAVREGRPRAALKSDIFFHFASPRFAYTQTIELSPARSLEPSSDRLAASARR